MFRLHLAERWEPKDYLEAISAVEGLYYIMTFRHDFADSPWLFEPMERDYRSSKFSRHWRYRDWMSTVTEGLVEHARLMADHRERLFVTKISHASPGFIDFEGLGDVIRALKEMVGDSVAFFTNGTKRQEENNQAKIKTEQDRISLERSNIELVREKLKLLDEIQARKERYLSREARVQIERALVAELRKIEDLTARGLLTLERRHKDG